MKKLISIILTLIIAVSCCIFTAHADDDTPAPSKITPSLAEALASADPEPEPGYGLWIVVYFSDEYDALNDMPSWPSHDAVNEYAEYLINKNKSIIDGDLKAVRSSGNTYVLPGFTIFGDIYPEDVAIIEQSEHVRLIDLIDPLSNNNGPYQKYNYKLSAALNVLSPDDFITVWVGNSAHIKTVADMPSWHNGPNHNIEETQYWISKARSEYSAYQKTIMDAFIAEAFDGVEDMQIFFADAKQYLVAVRVSDLERIAAHDCVRYIEYDGTYLEEPEIEAPDDPDLSYYQRKLCDQYFITDLDALDYEEVYYHSRESGYKPDSASNKYDWVLVRAFRGDLMYPQALNSKTVGGRRLTASSLGWAPFEFAYGIFDADKDKFFDLTDIDFGDYDGLLEVWRGLELNPRWGRIYEDSPYYDNVPAIHDYKQELCDKYSIPAGELIYRELFRHEYDRDDKTYAHDWVLVYAVREGFYPDALNDGIIGGRKLSAAQLYWYPFEFGFGIYDAEQDKFFDLAEIDFDDYPGLYEVWQTIDMTDPIIGVYENVPYFHVNPGDADGDGQVTVMDATKIQRVVAGLSTKYEIAVTSADVDGDGEVSVFDATRIQRYKAELCNLDGSRREDKEN